jgi:hypothetical protein
LSFLGLIPFRLLGLLRSGRPALVPAAGKPADLGKAVVKTLLQSMLSGGSQRSLERAIAAWTLDLILVLFVQWHIAP